MKIKKISSYSTFKIVIKKNGEKNMNLLFRRSREPKTAEECYSKAKDYLSKFLNNESRKDFYMVLNYLDQCLQIDPTYENAYFMKGTVLKAVNERTRAIEVYEQALIHLPNNMKIRKWMIIDLIEREETVDKALDCVDQALKIDPQSPEMNGLRAACLLKKGFLEEAIRTIDYALEIDPENVENLFQRGTILMVAKKWQEAKLAEEKLLSILKPQNSYDYEMKEQALEAIKLMDYIIAKESNQ